MTGRRIAVSSILLAVCLSPLAPRVHAAPGDLDTGFAGFGSQAIVTAAGRTDAMALAPDGKIVTVSNTGVQLVVRRYLPTGAPDLAFDADGVATFLNASYSMRANAVAVQPDGRIVVAGWVEDDLDDFLVARVLAGGGIDASFGSGGYRVVDIAGQGDHVEAVLVQPDGKILAAGHSRVGGDTDFSVVRLNANGTLDMSFNGDGKLTIGFGGDDVCHDLALQEDGKIVLAGDGSESFPMYDRDACLARLHPDGSLDDSFDYDGKMTAGLGDYDQVYGVAIQSDGRIVAVGETVTTAPNSEGKIVRFLPNGFPDPTLDGDGIMSLPDSDTAWDVAIQPDDRIVVLSVGDFESPPDVRAVVHRLQASGTFDPTFAGSGYASYDIGVVDLPAGLALLPDGRILLHGTTGPDAWIDNQNTTFLVRLWQDGSPDSGGATALGFPDTFLGPGSRERAAAMAVQPDGKIVVVGEVANAANTEWDFGVARFLPNGSPDLSFGDRGCATFSFHNLDVARAVALQPDGKIVVAGHTIVGDINFLVARFNSDGTLDPSFGFSGFNVLDFLGGPDYAGGVAIAPDGKIVVAGTVFNGARYVYGVCRFTSDGVADTSFDLDAKQLHEIVYDTPHQVSSVVVQDDYKIVLGGNVNGDFCLARYEEWGAVDWGFGPAGTGVSLHDMGGDDYLSALLRAPDGWFYAAGSRYWFGNSDFALAQFQPNGIAGGGAWIGGRAFVDFTGYDAALSVAWRSDGQVVAGGYGNGVITWAQFNSATTDYPQVGWLDLPGAGELASGASFVGPGYVLLAGTQEFNGDPNFALARFETVPDATETAVDDSPASASALGLRMHAAFPNPVANESVIAFELAQAGPARVALYDASGRRVRTLAAGAFTPGRHECVWDGRDDAGRRVAAGVYFVRAEAGAARAQQKVVLLR